MITKCLTFIRKISKLSILIKLFQQEQFHQGLHGKLNLLSEKLRITILDRKIKRLRETNEKKMAEQAFCFFSLRPKLLSSVLCKMIKLFLCLEGKGKEFFSEIFFLLFNEKTQKVKNK